MKNLIFSNSITYKFSKLIFESLTNIYRESFLFKLINGILLISKESNLYFKIKEFSATTPKYMYSYTFKLINFFIDKMENILIIISKKTHSIYIYSLIYKIFMASKNIFKSDKNQFLIYSSSFLFAYLTTNTFILNWNLNKFLIIIILFFTVVIIKNKAFILSIIEKSNFKKIIDYLLKN